LAGVTRSELALEGSLYNKTIPKSMPKSAPNAPMLNADTTLLHAINKQTVRNKFDSLKPHKSVLYALPSSLTVQDMLRRVRLRGHLANIVKNQYPESKAALPMNKYRVEYNIFNLSKTSKLHSGKILTKYFLNRIVSQGSIIEQ